MAITIQACSVNRENRRGSGHSIRGPAKELPTPPPRAASKLRSFKTAPTEHSRTRGFIHKIRVIIQELSPIRFSRHIRSFISIHHVQRRESSRAKMPTRGNSRIVHACENIRRFNWFYVPDHNNSRSANQGWTIIGQNTTWLEAIDDAEEAHRSIFEEGFYYVSAKIREFLNPAISTRNFAAPSPFISNAPDMPEYLGYIWLPKLNCPTFSGKCNEWFPFFDTFNSVIHVNASLNNIQRLQYLRASQYQLTGNISNVINTFIKYQT